MIRAILLFLSIQIVYYTSVFSQTVLPEATLTYDFSVDDGGKSTPLDTNLTGQRLVIYLKGTLSRLDNLSQAGRESEVFDSRTETGFMTREYGDQKLLIPVTSAEWQAQHSFYPDLAFQVDDGIYTIGTYNCRKTKELKAPQKIYSYTIYFDPALQMPNKNYDIAFPQINGLPVRIEMRFKNTVYTLQLTELRKESINPSVFEPPRKGYKTITLKEMKAMEKE